jgi:glycosyltransferase involved in cell wall biosynthesis
VRILHLNKWLPAPPVDGGKLRKIQQLDALRTDHDVVVFGRAASPADASWLQTSLPGVRVVETTSSAADGLATAREVGRFLERSPFDLVHVSGVPQWPGNNGSFRGRVLLDVDSIESRVLETLRDAGVETITDLDIAAVRALERHAFARADAVLACSSKDAAAITRMAPGARVSVVPNTIDVRSFPSRPLVSPGRRPIVLFTGFLAYRPNADACAHFVHDILPSVEREAGPVTFRMVGRLPPGEVVALAGTPGVELHADVPDIRPWLADADVVVVPLRAGSGTRLKILEAFAAGRPVVSTPLGCEGLAVADGTHLLVAGSAGDFASLVVRVLRDRALSASLVSAARTLVERTYDREPMAANLRAIVHRLGPR